MMATNDSGLLLKIVFTFNHKYKPSNWSEGIQIILSTDFFSDQLVGLETHYKVALSL